MEKKKIRSRCSQDWELCISLELSLQYLRMTVVCWLAAMCHHLYATVASIPRRDDPPSYLKYSLFAWGAPLLDLAIATFLQIREATVIWNIADLTPFNCWYIFFSPILLFSFSSSFSYLLSSISYPCFRLKRKPRTFIVSYLHVISRSCVTGIQIWRVGATRSDDCSYL